MIHKISLFFVSFGVLLFVAVVSVQADVAVLDSSGGVALIYESDQDQNVYVVKCRPLTTIESREDCASGKILQEIPARQLTSLLIEMARELPEGHWGSLSRWRQTYRDATSLRIQENQLWDTGTQQVVESIASLVGDIRSRQIVVLSTMETPKDAGSDWGLRLALAANLIQIPAQILNGACGLRGTTLGELLDDCNHAAEYKWGTWRLVSRYPLVDSQRRKNLLLNQRSEVWLDPDHRMWVYSAQTNYRYRPFSPDSSNRRAYGSNIECNNQDENSAVSVASGRLVASVHSLFGRPEVQAGADRLYAKQTPLRGRFMIYLEGAQLRVSDNVSASPYTEEDLLTHSGNLDQFCVSLNPVLDGR